MTVFFLRRNSLSFPDDQVATKQYHYKPLRQDLILKTAYRTNAVCVSDAPARLPDYGYVGTVDVDALSRSLGTRGEHE